MIRQQTTKELAKRIEPKYIRRNSGRRWLLAVSCFILTGGALAFWLVGGTVRRNAMINPGHVSASHALWENDCAKCHDGDGAGGFRKAVSDKACLQCHGATQHHPN